MKLMISTDPYANTIPITVAIRIFLPVFFSSGFPPDINNTIPPIVRNKIDSGKTRKSIIKFIILGIISWKSWKLQGSSAHDTIDSPWTKLIAGINKTKTKNIRNNFFIEFLSILNFCLTT